MNNNEINYFSYNRIEKFTQENKSITQIINELDNTIGSNNDFTEILNKADEITTNYSEEVKSKIAEELVKLLKIDNMKAKKDIILENLTNELYFIKIHVESESFIKNNPLVTSNEMIFNPSNLKILDDKIYLNSFIPPNEKNQNLEITDEKKFKFFEKLSKFITKNKINEILNKMLIKNFDFTTTYNSLNKEKYLNLMSKIILQNIIIESYENLFLDLINYEEEVVSKDKDDEDNEPVMNMTPSLKFDDFNKENLFKNITIINIFTRLFDQYEVDLKKNNKNSSSPSSSPSTSIEVINNHDPEFNPNSEEEDQFARDFFENIKNYDSSRMSYVPDPNHYAMIIHRKLNEMLSDDQFFNKKDELKNLIEDKIDNDDKLNTLFSNLVSSNLIIDSVNLFSIFLTFSDGLSNDDLELCYIIFSYYSTINDKEEFKKKSIDEKSDIIFNWFNSNYSKYKEINDNKINEEKKELELSKKRDKELEKEKKEVKKQEIIELKQIKEEEEKNKIIEEKAEKQNKIVEKIKKKDEEIVKGIKPKSFLEKYMIYIIIVVLLLLGVIGFFMFSGKSGGSDMDFDF